jgi:serine/threonine protein phosphatase PrpC
VRADNQDAFGLDEENGLFVIADGIGGKVEGAKASQMFVDRLQEDATRFARLLASSDPIANDDHRQRIFDFLVRRVDRANREIFEQGGGRMGTTCEVLLLGEEVAFVAHVGDSRVYLLRDGEIFQLTSDHTFAEEMKRRRERLEQAGEESDEDFGRYEHVLTRSIGGQPAVEIDTLFVDLQPGDEFILCSDGVSDVVGPGEMLRASEGHAPETLAGQLVDAALEGGSSDNVTAVVVQVPVDDRRSFDVNAPVDTIRKVSFLEEIELFEGLNRPDLLKLLRIVYRRSYEPGEYVIREGEETDELYMILEGAVDLMVDDREITRLEPGEHFGELALFGPTERTADARAGEASTLLVLPGAQLEELADAADPELGNRLLKNLLAHASRRIRDTTTQLLAAESEAEEWQS